MYHLFGSDNYDDCRGGMDAYIGVFATPLAARVALGSYDHGQIARIDSSGRLGVIDVYVWSDGEGGWLSERYARTLAVLKGAGYVAEPLSRHLLHVRTPDGRYAALVRVDAWRASVASLNEGENLRDDNAWSHRLLDVVSPVRGWAAHSASAWNWACENGVTKAVTELERRRHGGQR